MLNYSLIEKLYEELPAEKKRQLRKILFSNSSQSITYFKKRNDVSLSKVEKVANFFGLSLQEITTGNLIQNSQIQNVNFVDSQKETAELKKEIELLREKYMLLENSVQYKDELIHSYKEQINLLNILLCKKN